MSRPLNVAGAAASTDFPILCETCLGDDPYVRMQKKPSGAACKICERPYSLFRWKPGGTNRYKATVVCQACAKLKNVCQTCLFDLQYGLPVQVRDKFIANEDKIILPSSESNRQFAIASFEQNNKGTNAQTRFSLKNEEENEPSEEEIAKQKLLQKFARNRTPYYRRNLAKICSFFVKGECNRGDECPYSHDLTRHKDTGMAHQKIKDRFIGEKDPVASKILKKMNLE